MRQALLITGFSSHFDFLLMPRVKVSRPVRGVGGHRSLAAKIQIH
jgi:hypothetical protein